MKDEAREEGECLREEKWLDGGYDADVRLSEDVTEEETTFGRVHWE